MAAKGIGKDEPLTRYEIMQAWRQKRRAMNERAQQQADLARSSMVTQINTQASNIVQLSEQILRNKVDKKA